MKEQNKKEIEDMVSRISVYEDGKVIDVRKLAEVLNEIENKLATKVTDDVFLD